MADIPGIVVPLVAAFTDDTSTLSEVRVARLVRFHRDRGASGFVVNGECGDAFQIAHTERKQILEWVLRDSGGLPVWVNATAMTTAGVVDLCQHASRHGAKGAIVCPPPIGRFFEHEAKGMIATIQRHGNISTLFADPHGRWAKYEVSLKVAQGVGEGLSVLSHPSPDEMVLDAGIVTPLGLFGADKFPVISEMSAVIRQAVQSIVNYAGLSRFARAVTIAMDCDVGGARSPVFELDDEGQKILKGLLKVLGVE